MTVIAGGRPALYLSKKGHTVSIVDNFARRQWDHELGVETLTPILPLTERLRTWKALTGLDIDLFAGDVCDYEFLSTVMRELRAGGGRPLRRAARRAVLDDRSQARRLHPGQQRRRHAEPAVRDP